MKLYFALNCGRARCGHRLVGQQAILRLRPAGSRWSATWAARGSRPTRPGPSFDPLGLPLVPGLIEVITPQTTAAGGRHADLAGNEGKIAILTWRGPPMAPQASGVGWILAEDWVPYQAREFVTPSFPGYVSGHSTFSRSAAEVLTLFTGSEFFPGGLEEFVAPAGDYLRFDVGPSQSVTLQWATYYDAADEAGLSRILGGIHVTVDDYTGRIIGSLAGKGAFFLARQYFQGTAHRSAGRPAMPDRPCGERSRQLPDDNRGKQFDLGGIAMADLMLPDKHARTWATLAHLGGFGFVLFGLGHIIIPLVIWLFKRDDDPFIDDQAREALNFQLSVSIYMLIAGALFCIGIGLIVAIIVGIADIILIILAAIRGRRTPARATATR